MKTKSILIAGILGFTALASHAAVVSWGAAQGIAGDSDVSTAGTLVGAFNMGFTGVTGTTVNGVTFAPFALSGASGSIGDFSFTGSTFGGNNALGAAVAPFSSLSAPYQALLGSAVITGSPGGNFTLTISGLVTGTTYAFQWWSSSSQSFTGFETTTATSSASVVSLDKNTTDALGGLGQWAIGTFTADSASQTIGFTSVGRPVVNGFQLRAVAVPVPEPGSALAGVLALGVCLSGLGSRQRRVAT